MPTAVSYPGVYIEEIPSGVRTITGVATSITAFLGRTARGPLDEPVVINSFGDFERKFGGLKVDCPMSYAVKDFFVNGGSQAVVIRLFKPRDATPAKVVADVLTVDAASPGAWGNSLRIRVDHKVCKEVATRYGLDEADLFNLSVRDTATGQTEVFLNVTVKESPRRVDRVLASESSVIRAPQLPNPLAVPIAHADPASGKTVWEDDAASSKVANKVEDSLALDAAIYKGNESDKTGLYALEKTDLLNLLCLPPDTREGDTDSGVYGEALKYCVKRRAMLIVDAPAGWKSVGDITKSNNKALTDLGLSGEAARNAALFFPRVTQSDLLREGQLDTFVPCGIVAGVMARTDVQRGVWKAPAGIDAALSGVAALSVSLTDAENGQLNPLGVNCLRSFPVIGRVIWGARTLRGADLLADEYKYIPVRRLALYIEESLYRGTQWVVFEPNDSPLWAQIRLSVGAFMHNLFRQGAFQGTTPREAYFVKCDKETTTQNDINLGIVNIVVGFAPLKPAEFVIIKIQQIASQNEV